MALLRCVAALDDLKLEGDQAVGVTIVKRALEEPIRQIVINAGVEGAVIVMEVKKNKKAAYGFNAATEERLSGAKDDRLCAMPLLLYHLRLFMNALRFVSPRQLQDILLNVAIARPVFIWGAPGIGKSSVVQQFAEQLGLACVSLLGSQLAPEDIIGVPQISEGKSRFCPPAMIARDQPYCLFLDELNACSHEVQKSFYSLIHERRVGDYQLPDGSIIIGAGNRAHDSAIVKPMSSALLNRMVHVHLQVSHRDWLDWAAQNNIHPKVMEYVGIRPDHLWSQPPKHEEPFSTPRSWHMLSDALNHFQSPSASQLEIVAYGCLSPQHAGQFLAFLKQHSDRFMLNRILKGEESWPGKPEDRDLLYFLAQSFRAQLLKELPAHREAVTPTQRQTAHQAKALLKDLAGISLEIAQMMVSDQPNEERLPDWFLVEIVRDLPRLVENRNDGPAG